jgi:hypothetical protein
MRWARSLNISAFENYHTLIGPLSREPSDRSSEPLHFSGFSHSIIFLRISTDTKSISEHRGCAVRLAWDFAYA